MRLAHSLKGGAACVGLHHIQTLAHQLETVLEALSAHPSDIDLELENLLLQAFDCLRSPLLEEMQTGTSNQTTALAKAQPIWEGLHTKLGSHQPQPDVTQFLFTEEVNKGLKRMETILRNSNETELREALQTQIEIFKGIGAVSNLPGFTQIAQVALEALAVNPHQIKTVGELTKNNFRAAQAEILKGDRHQGGQPDPALLAFTFSATKPPDTPTPDSPLSPLPHLPHLPLLGLRQDWSNLELLDNLIGELLTQDNRFLTQHQQLEEALQALTRCTNRLNQQTRYLHRWLNQATPSSASPDLIELSSPPTRTNPSTSPGNVFLPITVQAMIEEIAHLNEAIQDFTLLEQQSQHILKQRQKTLKQVQTHLLHTHMSPIGELLNQFPRMVRDLAVSEGKSVELQLEGTNTLVDKAILEKLYDPLVHLIRNAFDHGIEPPSIREALGKPLTGTITIRAWYRGNYLFLDIQDDGQGIDPEKIRTAAVALNLLSPTESTQVTDEQLHDYLFTPSFSTTTTVSNLSGRGVGLYAVRSQINLLKGVVTLSSRRGQGTTFTIRLPLTLTTTKLLVFSLNGNLLAVPVDMIAAILIAAEQLLQSERGQQFYYWKDQVVPVYPSALLAIYRYPNPALGKQELYLDDNKSLDTTKPWQISGKIPLILLAHRDQVIAVKADQILLEQDLVIKPFNEAIAPPPCLRGCTILGDGRIAPVLDVPTLVEKWLQMARSQIPTPTLPAPVAAVSPISSILVIDDSLTIRQALSTTLSKAGYRVILAKDGWEGLTQLRQRSNITAVICDIEMPRMNGLEFLTRCQQQGFRKPIIILTNRNNPKYRQLAQQLGASGYLTKPYLDRELLGMLQENLQR
jgi:chemotaxis family two-component system sensor histidine kinase/response regulator PixL